MLQNRTWLLVFLLPLLHCRSVSQQDALLPIPLKVLEDKIKGGWAGQTIGVTFGGPYEFRFNGTFINEDQPLNTWDSSQIRNAMLYNAGLFDDVYMDLTFVDVFERLGLNAPVDSFASAYANAEYMLWHANQAGRYNILHGIPPPLSGHWKNNPHADDIDFQIESDFAGLMSPGMPKTAAQISDRIGHIMNYGDGWYGGVFMATLYALAFTHNDIQEVVYKALKAIPQASGFYQCIDDVIRWHTQYPDDWRQAWFEIQKKWSTDIGCPDGVFNAFNIDAKINAAYVVLGLLYGNGDFGKTMEIATRAGQDADCNPSSACGVLGTLLGYEKIPDHWKQGLAAAEDIDFKYTTMSLNKTYKVGLEQAKKNTLAHGGKLSGDTIYVKAQGIEPVQLETGFPGMFPQKVQSINVTVADTQHIAFSGTGIVLRGRAEGESSANRSMKISVQMDGAAADTIDLPLSFTTRRHEVYWAYELPEGEHRLALYVLSPSTANQLKIWDAVIYGSGPSNKRSSVSH
ncbi:MAG: hypothetical protein RL732_3 [Bacteroidota bacterium]